MQSEQLALNVSLKEGLRFDSFFVEPNSPNADTLRILQAFINTPSAHQNILWGEAQVGKTHLLQACCAQQAELNQAVNYLPLNVLKSFGEGVLASMSSAPLVVVDDVDVVIGQSAWETALFNLINKTREQNQRLLLSATQNPRHLDCVLPDLASRLIWGGSYQVYALSDASKPKLLKKRAEQRGFELSDRVIDYLFRHYPRDIESLMDMLNTLDNESLRQKTKITVPFVKQLFG